MNLINFLFKSSPFESRQFCLVSRVGAYDVIGFHSGTCHATSIQSYQSSGCK
jgi:hypothetical protein